MDNSNCTTTEEEVIFYDTDAGGVVSNIAYLRYVERARCQLFTQLGMPLAEMSETQIYPTVYRTEIDYLRPAQLGDQLQITAKIASIEKLRLHCEFRIGPVDAPDQPFAIAKQTVILVKLPEGKPIRPPKDWTT